MVPGYSRHEYDGTGTPNYRVYREYEETPYEAPEEKTTYRYGDNMALPAPTLSQSGGYALNGFTFDGWYDNAEYTGRKYTAIGADETGDKEYYAKWRDTQAPTYTGSEWHWGVDSGGSSRWWRMEETGRELYIRT